MLSLRKDSNLAAASAAFNDFSDLCSAICINYDQLIIVGDFHTNTDNPQDKGTKLWNDNLHNVDLTQHIN